MKKLSRISFLIILSFGLSACGKNETTTDEGAKTETNQPEETARLLTSEKGDSIYITYFAKDDVVAVKLKIGGEEKILEAKGSSEKGNPVLTDGEFGWEMFTDGKSGRLFTKDSEGQFYKER